MKPLDIQQYKADSLPMAKEIEEISVNTLRTNKTIDDKWTATLTFTTALETTLKTGSVKKAKKPKVQFVEHFRISSTGFECFDTISIDKFSGDAVKRVAEKYYRDMAEANKKRDDENAKARALRNQTAENNAALDK